PPLAGDLLVRLRDVDDLQNTRKRLQASGVHLSVVADQPDGGALLAGNGRGLVAQLPDSVNDRLDLLRGRAVCHDDEHAANPSGEAALQGSRQCNIVTRTGTSAAAGGPVPWPQVATG